MEHSLTYLANALPISGRALGLRTSFNRSLISSLKYLLEACVEVIPSDLFSQTIQKINSLNPTSKLSCLLGILNADFFKAVEQQDVERVKKVVENLNRDARQLQELSYLNWSEFDDYYIPLMKPVLTYELEEEVNFFPVASEDLGQAISFIQRGLNIYKESFPDFFEEFEELVGEILILNAEGLGGGSSFNMFGMIFTSISKGYIDKSEAKVPDLLHFFVHEQAHLYVYLLAKDDPLILNPLEKHEAPILRKEKRPLIGIYHAVFVLARVQYVLRKALSYNVIPEEERGYCEETVDYFRKRFYVGYETLQKHAQMTPLAEVLITSASKLL